MAPVRLWHVPTWILSCLAVSGCGEVDWSDAKNMPFAAKTRLELAGDGWLWRRSMLSLVCASDQRLHLVMVTELPGGRERLKVERREDATIFINGIDQQISDLGMRAVALGPPDTIVSDPLPAEAVDRMIEWFGATAPQKVDVVGFEETGIFMQGEAVAADISAIAQTCQRS